MTEIGSRLQWVLGAAVLVAACSAAPDDEAPPTTSFTTGDPLSGGTTTVYDQTNGAYANAAANLTDADFDSFNLGHSLFNRNWVTAPATTSDIDGVGPLFNQRSCSACHAHDGRAPVFDSSGRPLGILFRLSVPGQDAHGGPLGDPVYGGQLRPVSTQGIPVEGVMHISYLEMPGAYGDGTPYSLQAPSYSIDGWGYGEPSPDLMISPRVGPFTIGLGLLGAISEDDILKNQRDGKDGIFGKPNYVWDAANQTTALGRFGWKANVPSVLDQTAGAFVGDMGITSSVDPTDTCTPTMTACTEAPNGGDPEIDDDRLQAVAFYMQTLAVPARRNMTDKTALRGEGLFSAMGCATCHVPTFETGSLAGVSEAEHQKIHPYTDLLLHDMGPGLADGRPDYQASGSEWRTPPLWGIGLLEKVNGHDLLLHDGRARGLEEAILWHGGEAEIVKERFRNADAADREALITFLDNL